MMQHRNTRNGRQASGLGWRSRCRNRIGQAVSSILESLEPRVCLSTATLVKDINTATAGSNPQNFIQMSNANGSFLYFDATDQAHGDELWRTDGTNAGTTLVKDINPGSDPSHPSDFVVINGTLYFNAYDSTHGFELWKSDGTSAGTQLVQDINVGVGDSNPYDLTNVNGTLFFVTDTQSAGGTVDTYALYKYDPVANVVTPLKTFDAVPLNTSGASDTLRQPDALTAVGSTLFFEAFDATKGQSLWKSDGTTTAVAVDINTTAIDSKGNADPTGFPDDILASDIALSPIGAGTPSNLLFAAFDPVNGTQLWRYSVTNNTATMITDFNNPGQPINAGANANPMSIVNAGSIAYFSADAGVLNNGISLWKTDGATAKEISDFGAQDSTPVPAFLDTSTGTLYFTAQSTGIARSLFTVSGTYLTSTVSSALTTPDFPDQPEASSQNINSLVKFPGTGLIYFNETNDATGSQLWKTDGTPANTAIATAAGQQASVLNATPAGVIGNFLVLTANDSTHGTELWVTSDGTNLTQLNPINTGTASSNPGAGAVLGNSYIYAAQGNITSGLELFKTDLTTGVTSLITDISGGTGVATFESFSNAAVTSNGMLFFAADDGSGHGDEVWVTNGTAAGTHKITITNPILNQLASTPNPSSFLAVGNTCYFIANDVVDSDSTGSNDGTELWKTDGTTATLVTNIAPGNQNGIAPGTKLFTIPASGLVYFTANDGTNGDEIWQSNGTAAGTKMVTATGLNPGSARGVVERNTITVLNGKLYFSGTDNTNSGLYRFDPATAQFTFLGDSKHELAQITATSPIVNVNGTLFFFGDDVNLGNTLWKYDGNAVTRVNFNEGGVGQDDSFSNLTASGNLLFFDYNTTNNTDNPNGSAVKLWRSDGTDAGTFMVKDILPTSDGAVPSNLTDNNGRLYFTADDGVHGNELWQSDGTAAGTYLVQDIRPGNDSGFGKSSDPSNLISINGTLYFAAASDAFGDELYKTTNDFLGIRSASANTSALPTLSGSTITIPNVAGNSYFVYADLSLPAYYGASVNLSQTGSSVEFDAVQHLNSLSITGGAASLGISTDTTVLVTKSLSISTPATFDINSGGIIVDYSGSSPLTSVRGILMAGRGTGNWQGIGGITSTAASMDQSHFAIGYAENSDLATLSAAGSYSVFAGQSVDSTAVLIRYTRGADANLDGVVNAQDVTVVGARYGKTGSGQWEMGDFDYSGAVDDPDVNALSTLYNPSAASVHFGQAIRLQPAVFAAVPLSSAVVSGVVADAAIKTSTTGNPAGLSTNPKIADNATLTLPAGSYYFSQLDLKNNVKITFTGPATVYVSGNITLKDGNSIVAFNNDPSNLIIYQTPGSTFTVHDRNMLVARVIIPGVAVTMHDNNTVQGCLVAGSLLTNKNCNIANFTLYNGTDSILTSTGKDPKTK